VNRKPLLLGQVISGDLKQQIPHLLPLCGELRLAVGIRSQKGGHGSIPAGGGIVQRDIMPLALPQ